MANINGLPVNSAVTHAEFMSRTEDTSTVAKIALQDPDVASGASISNVQKAINKAFEGVGAVDENDSTINDYSSNNYILDGDNRKEAIEKLDAQLGTTQTQLDALDLINSQDVSIGAIGSTPNVNGMTLAGQVLNLEPASESFGGVVTTGTQTIAGDKTLSGNTSVGGTLTVAGTTTLNGNLVVNGTTTTVNSATVDTVDPNITVNKTGNDASSEGAGLTVDRTGTKGSLKYENALASKFKIGDLAAEAEVVTVSHAQTLTNKTLTSPVINSPTGITNSDVGLANVTNDAQLKRAANDFNSFTEKTSLVDDDVFIIEDSAASGAKKFVKKVNLGAGGSGGGGAVNLITNGSADSASVSIFTPYLDSGSRPTDGVGPGSTVTTSISAVSPLTGTKSYLLTKPASNTQGEGWSTPATALDLSYRGKVLKISVDYIVNSGTFFAGSRTTDSDIIWSCYDITNSKIVEPSNIKMFSNSTTNSDKFEATVQFDSNCTSFRLIAHVATTSTSAYEIKVDNVTVSPSVYVYGTPVTDWQSYTPTVVGLGTVTITDSYWKRVGDSLYIRGRMTLGTTTAVTATVGLPSGHVVDDSDMTIQSTAGGNFTNNASGTILLPVVAPLDTGVSMSNAASGGLSKILGTAVGSSGNVVGYSVGPITVKGLSSSVQMSDSADTRLMLARYKTAAGQSIPNSTFTIVDFGTKDFDTHGLVTTGASWKFTATTTGYFRVSTHIRASTALNAVNFAARVYKNGVPGPALADNTTDNSASGRGDVTGSTIVQLVAGDFVDIRVTQNSGGAISLLNDADYVYVDIEKIQGPQAIAANENVNASYSTSAGNVVGTADTLILFATKQHDSHGAYNTSTGLFTAPIAGKYRVSATLTTASYTLATNQQFVMQIYKNGTVFRRPARTAGTGAAVNLGICGSTTLDLLAGETISIYAGSSVATTLVAGVAENNFSIEKVG